MASNPRAQTLLRTSAEIRERQPWREVYPFAPGSRAFLQLESRYPEYLSWTFDSGNVFDHPWQQWKSQSSRSNTDEGSQFGLPDLTANLPGLDDADRGPRDELDRHIRRRKMDAVRPEVFNYLAPLERYRRERPYRLQLPPIDLDGFKMTNIVTRSYPVNIYDISTHGELFTLADSGFEYAECPVRVHGWTDKSVTRHYIPQLSDWLRSYLDCEEVFVYSYNFRHHSEGPLVPVQRPWGSMCHAGPQASDDYSGDDYNLNRYLSADKIDGPYDAIDAVRRDPSGPCHWKTPLLRVHCDASMNTHRRRLPFYFPDDYEGRMEKRIRLLSIWRPLSDAILDCPLALCDFRTLDPADLVPMDIVYPHLVDEVYEVRYNPSHRWFYKKSMAPGDVIIFKLHDTLETEATVCPHSAFVDPSAPDDAPKRASIEVKVMVFG